MKIKNTSLSLVTLTLAALGLAALGACGTAGGSNNSGTDCTSDSDCKGSRVCVHGTCEDPSTNSSSSSSGSTTGSTGATSSGVPAPPCDTTDIVVQSTTSNSVAYDATCAEDVNVYPAMQLCDDQGNCAWVQAGGEITDTVPYGATVSGTLSCCVYPSTYCGSSYYDQTCDTPWAGAVRCKCNSYAVSATADQCPATYYQGCSP